MSWSESLHTGSIPGVYGTSIEAVRGRWKRSFDVCIFTISISDESYSQLVSEENSLFATDDFSAAGMSAMLVGRTRTSFISQSDTDFSNVSKLPLLAKRAGRRTFAVVESVCMTESSCSATYGSRLASVNRERRTCKTLSRGVFSSMGRSAPGWEVFNWSFSNCKRVLLAVSSKSACSRSVARRNSSRWWCSRPRTAMIVNVPVPRYTMIDSSPSKGQP
mmetsp:Transcript_21470/g.35504  ORF Transcript_21470/g.35504 Transcript_21470/m.35504 type:complete len:219 (-) Transcript_21470:881-1537(-)